MTHGSYVQVTDNKPSQKCGAFREVTPKLHLSPQINRQFEVSVWCPYRVRTALRRYPHGTIRNHWVRVRVLRCVSRDEATFCIVVLRTGQPSMTITDTQCDESKNRGSYDDVGKQRI